MCRNDFKRNLPAIVNLRRLGIRDRPMAPSQKILKMTLEIQNLLEADVKKVDPLYCPSKIFNFSLNFYFETR